MKYLIVDIDGTIAELTHRLNYIQKPEPEWDKFFDACDMDEPITPMIQFLMGLSSDYVMVFITGRPERTRQKTIEWLDEYLCRVDGVQNYLFMRKDGDHRHDHIVKKELFEKSGFKMGEVLAVFEDRDRVVEMWREMGLLCLQPKKGDY